jgi:hypothetical protein
MGCENKNAFYETATNPMVRLCKFETLQGFSIQKASSRENKISSIAAELLTSNADPSSGSTQIKIWAFGLLSV